MATVDDLEAEDVRVLADIGFMAISRGLDNEADAIFDGVVAARPSGEAGYIGRALVRLYRSQADEAARILRALPPSDAVQLFLGMSLVRGGDKSGAREVLADLVTTAAGTPPAETAQLILDEIGGLSDRR